MGHVYFSWKRKNLSGFPNDFDLGLRVVMEKICLPPLQLKDTDCIICFFVLYRQCNISVICTSFFLVDNIHLGYLKSTFF